MSSGDVGEVLIIVADCVTRDVGSLVCDELFMVLTGTSLRLHQNYAFTPPEGGWVEGI